MNKNRPFMIYKEFSVFKIGLAKIHKTKLKYWLDDYYTGGKDGLCDDSKIMFICSQNLKLQNSTFF